MAKLTWSRVYQSPKPHYSIIIIIVMVNIGVTTLYYGSRRQRIGVLFSWEGLLWTQICAEPLDCLTFPGRGGGGDRSRGRLPQQPGQSWLLLGPYKEEMQRCFHLHADFPAHWCIGLGEPKWKQKNALRPHPAATGAFFVPTWALFSQIPFILWNLFCWGQRGHRCRGWAILKGLEMNPLATQVWISALP